MSRPLRDQERGYRRLTVGVSLVLLCVGLALTARDSYRVMELYNAQAGEAACREYNARRPATAAPEECERVATDAYLSRPFSLVFEAMATFAVATLHRESTFFLGLLGFAGGHILTLTIALGIAVSLILAVVPWAAFYSVRWVARGFDGRVRL